MLTILRNQPKYDVGISKDDKKIILLPASKGMYEEILKKFDNNKNESIEKQLDIIYELLFVIMNNNTEDIKISYEEVKELDPMTAMQILREYVEFMQNMKSDPN